jgi:hypothetical protein
LPPELQERVHQEVMKTKSRSGWSVQKTLVVLGIPRRSYYRWLAEKSWQQEKGEPVKPVQPYEATAEEKAAVVCVERVPSGAGGESVDASEDQAALPGGEWGDGAE